MRKFQIIKTAITNIKQDDAADGVVPMRGQFKRVAREGLTEDVAFAMRPL